MPVAILLGACAGIVGFLPLRFALVSYRKVLSDDSTLRLAAFSLVAFLVSLVILVVALFVCSRVARDMVVAFGVTEILTLIVVTSAYVIYRNRSGTKGALDKRGREADG